MIPMLAGRLAIGSARLGSMARSISLYSRALLHEIMSGDDDDRRRIIAAARASMPRIRVSTNIPQTMAWLSDIQRHKIPHVTAIALTRTAKELQHILEREVDRVFDKPVAFTRRAFAIKPATYANQTAEIFIKTAQVRYLAPQVAGGRRLPKRSEERFARDTSAPGMYWIPGEGVRLNTHGNLSLAQVKKIAAGLQKGRSGVFFGKPRPDMPFGIWARAKPAGLRPLLIQVAVPMYQKRLDMQGIAARHAQAIFNREFARAWKQIIG